jgi:hypothetical protein
MAKTKSITIRGVEYPSHMAAAEALGVSTSAVTRAQERGYLQALGLKRRGDASRPCRVGSVDYPSRAAAAKALGVSAGAVSTYLAVKDVIDKSEVGQ